MISVSLMNNFTPELEPQKKNKTRRGNETSTIRQKEWRRVGKDTQKEVLRKIEMLQL
jgi:hypothetical protein